MSDPDIDPDVIHKTYLRAYVEALGGGRLEGTMVLAETTEHQRAAIALAVHHAKKGDKPATKVVVVKEVRELVRAPAAPAAPAAPPTT